MTDAHLMDADVVGRLVVKLGAAPTRTARTGGLRLLVGMGRVT